MKRITIITGHYGSGKSEFSVNFAIQKKLNMLIDLDIVNPYFRSRELADLLDKNNIKSIASTLEHSLGSDLPYVSPLMYTPFRNDTVSAIIDLGGNDVGATLVRQFVKEVDMTETDFLSVVNIYRPDTSSVRGIVSMVRSIEGKSGLAVTGLINNSNLLEATTIETITDSIDIVQAAAEELHIPIVYTSLAEKFVPLLPEDPRCGEIISLAMHLRKKWMGKN